jgi:Histone RNA hairpin-binding protein RNA-binding domain
METPDKPAVFKAGRSISIKGSRNANTTLEKDGPKTQKSTAAAFDKLDPDQFARRIEQRRRAVQHGKNTVGYEEYRKQVPKEERRPRSMQHPSTPDPTLDIPTKRWQGLVKAWYVYHL